MILNQSYNVSVAERKLLAALTFFMREWRINMTLQEANTKLYLETEMLQRYEKIGLIKGTPLDDGTMDYPMEELQRTIQLNFLEKGE